MDEQYGRIRKGAARGEPHSGENGMADWQEDRNRMALQALEEQLQAMLHAHAAGREGELAQAEERQAMTAQASNMMSGFEEIIQEQLATIAGRLEQLSRRLDEAQRVHPPQRPEEVPGYAELKTALHNLVEHLELAEGRTAEAIGLLHERIEELASRAGEAPAGLPQLEERIEALTRRLEDLRNNIGGAQEVRAYVDERVDELAQRVETVHDIARQLPQQVERMLAAQPAAPAVDAQIVDMVERMQQKLERLAASARQTEQLRQELDAVQQELASLRSQPAPAVDETALQEMRNDLRALSAQVAQKADRSELSALEATLEERLEARMQALLAELPAMDSGDPARLEALEEKVRALRNLVEEALGQPLLAIEDRLKAHDAQLQALGESIGRIDQLEQAIATLRDSVAGGGAGNGEEIAALKTGMAELEAFAKKSDERTREMLQAVHQTLAEVVERLMALEERTTGAAPSAGKETGAAIATEGEAAAAAQPLQDAAHDLLAEAAPEAGAVEETHHNQASAASSTPAIDPAEIAEVVSLLEQRAEEPRSETTPDLGGDEAPAISAAPRPAQEDFIAAARRAALAATRREQQEQEGSSGLFGGLLGRVRAKRQEEAAVASPAPEVEEDAGKGNGLFASLRQRLGAAGGEDGKAAADSGSRKRLMLIGFVLLAAAALWLNRQQAAPVSPAPAAIEEEAPDAPQKAQAPTVEEKAGEPEAPHKETPDRADAPPGAGPAPRARDSQRTGLFTPNADTPMAITTASIAPTKAAEATRRVQARTAGLATATGNSGQKAATGITVPKEIMPESLRQAASRGDGKALYLIAVRYLKGMGLPRDAARAFHWFKLAAEEGVVPAMYRLGAMYEKGIGTQKDLHKARTWYERAAGRGNVRAMHNLGVLLASGLLGTRDMGQAAHWFRKAAQYGVRDSQFNLAVLYHRGQGVPRNLAEAWFWYAVAARKGDAAAARQARELAAYLGPQRLAAQRKKLESFRPQTPDRDANVVVIDRPEWRAGQTQGSTKEAKPLAGAALVHEVQKLLSQLGYDAGPADGILGNRTANAIRLFQMQNRMPVNGRPDMALLQRLRALAGNA